MLNQSIKVSAIVPTYNAKQYISVCAGCLESQTFDSYELIFVDDCSDDGTYEWLLEYKKDKENVSVYRNDKNIGAAESRNFGLKKARGKYVIFLDADDYFYENMLSESYYKAEENAADMVVFSYEWADVCDEDMICTKHIKPNKIECDQKKIELLYLAETVPWNKLVRRDFLLKSNIRFQNLKSNNDVFYSYATTLKANKIVFIDKVLLKYYYGRVGSLTSTRLRKRVYILEAYNALYKEILQDKKLENIKTDFLNMLLDDVLVLLRTSIYEEEVKLQLCNSLSNFKVLIEGIKNNWEKIYPHNQRLFERIIEDGYCCIDNKYELFTDSVRDMIDSFREQNKKIALWGCGKLGKEFIKMLNQTGLSIDCVIDNDRKKQGTVFEGYTIQSYSEQEDIDIILILNPLFYEEIKEEARGKELIDVSQL